MIWTIQFTRSENCIVLYLRLIYCRQTATGIQSMQDNIMSVSFHTKANCLTLDLDLLPSLDFVLVKGPSIKYVTLEEGMGSEKVCQFVTWGRG